MDKMYIIERKELDDQEMRTVLALWNQEYPEKLNYTTIEDFETYLTNLTNTKHYLVQNDQNQILGWSSSFEREDKIWFAVILDGSTQGKGYGTKIINHLKEKEIQLNGWVIDHGQDKKKDGTSYKSPLGFYLKNDFRVYANNRLELEKISAVHIQWNK